MLISSETGDPLLRSAAVLGLLDYFTAARESMLVVGLRGGAIPLVFARRGWRVRVLEPDSVALGVAISQMGFRTGEVPTILADPRVALRGPGGPFAAIVVDAFAGGSTPYHLATSEFCRELRSHLNSGGILAVVVQAASWDDPLVASMAATLREALPNVIALLPASRPTRSAAWSCSPPNGSSNSTTTSFHRRSSLW